MVWDRDGFHPGLDQSDGHFAAIDVTMREVDQVMRSTMAIVEHSAAATNALAQDSGDLQEMIGRFHIGSSAGRRAAARPKSRAAG